MPVNIDDVARPVLSDSSIELVEELRALKARAKDTLTRVQELETAISSSLSASTLGRTLIAQSTPSAMLDTLGAEAFGKTLFATATPTEAQDALGMTTGLEVTMANPGGITLPNYMGNLSFRLGSFVSNTDDNQPFTFSDPFTSQCFGVVSIGTSAVSAHTPISFHTPSIAGAVANRDDGVGGDVTIYYLAIGV